MKVVEEYLGDTFFFLRNSRFVMERILLSTTSYAFVKMFDSIRDVFFSKRLL